MAKKTKTPTTFHSVVEAISQQQQPRRRRAPPAVEPAEPMKRLTISLPLSLHTRLMIACAASETKISDVVRELLEDYLPQGRE